MAYRKDMTSKTGPSGSSDQPDPFPFEDSAQSEELETSMARLSASIAKLGIGQKNTLTRNTLVMGTPASYTLVSCTENSALEIASRMDPAKSPPKIATVNEAAEVGRLLHDFNIEFEAATPGAKMLGERLGQLLASPSMFAIVVGEPAIAAGLVSVRPNVWYEGTVGLLDELYVTPELRNQGIGTAILEFLQSHAKKNGIDLIEINVDESNLDGQRFYESNGYSPINPDTGERSFYYFRELTASS